MPARRGFATIAFGMSADAKRTCAEKNAYPTHALAAATARDQMRNGGPPLRVYRCPVCGKYHLTKQVDERGV